MLDPVTLAVLKGRLEQIACYAAFGCPDSAANTEELRRMLKEMVAMASEDKALILRLLPLEEMRQQGLLHAH